jgi:pimeloyl-ACP methyl ester carboxylesterase
VDLDRVAVGGHSLGAVTALGIGYDAERTDPRVDATIPVSGGPLPLPGPGYDWPPTPMLLAHGVADATAPVAVGDAVFDMASPPVWYLRTSADHAGVLTGDHGELLADAIDAFLDAELRGEPEALAGMGDVVAASRLGEWRVRPASSS